MNEFLPMWNARAADFPPAYLGDRSRGARGSHRADIHSLSQMTWDETKAAAAESLKGLRGRFSDAEVRLIIRALGRLFQTTKEKQTMQTPTIIVLTLGPDHYQIDVSGRFGGGFRGVRKDRNGVISMLGHLKTYE
jgi:hypothetical protein